MSRVFSNNFRHSSIGKEFCDCMSVCKRKLLISDLEFLIISVMWRRGAVRFRACAIGSLFVPEAMHDLY